MQIANVPVVGRIKDYLILLMITHLFYSNFHEVFNKVNIKTTEEVNKIQWVK